MKLNSKSALLAGVLAAGLAGCGDEELVGPPQPPPEELPTAQAIDVAQNITADTPWKALNTYTLKSHVFVESGTLTIEPGTVIKGDENASLVITQNAKLDAVGTAEKPIVFTSSKPEGSRKAGDWAGVVMLGKARINVAGGSQKIEGFPASQTGTTYGGTDDAHDCGKLKYARIEFAGYELSEGNELNGLTMGGCGTATEVDYVQVHLGADDGVEMFGGTANLKHIVITQPDDDGLDWDIGWRGNVQFLVVQQNGDVGNNAFESDNNPNNNEATPVSNPTVYNVTLVGSGLGPKQAGKTQQGMHLKNGTAGTLRNVIVSHFADTAVDIDKASTATEYNEGRLSLQSFIFWDVANLVDTIPSAPNKSSDGTVADTTGFDEKTLLAAAGNRVVDPQLGDALNLTAPNFQPAAGSPALVAANAATPPAGGFFDPSATFVGAVGSVNWLAGWTAFPAN